MQILHTISSFGVKSGGTSTCVYDLLKALNEHGCHTDIVTLEQPDSTDRIIGNGESWIKLQSFDVRTPFQLSYSLKQFLQSENEYDLYHTNGLWLYCNHITASIARKKGKPYIISPHGMLYPQALAWGNWKKALMRKLCFNKDLAHAVCIHVTCKEEMKFYRMLGFTNPVAVIPNPVSFYSITDLQKEDDVFRVGFLGRIHPRKQVERLIYAWNEIGNQIRDSELLIMGSGDEIYQSFLQKEIERLRLDNVRFVGFVSGNEKYKKLYSLSCLCVPSDFENFGMIITEALSVGVPVIASKGTPWEELNTHHCGWWIESDVPTLAVTLRKALQVSEKERIKMGERGKLLIRENYSTEIVTEKMKRLYAWCVDGGEKPEFVYLK